MPITLPISPTNLFGNATVTIPLSNLDNNFSQIFNAVDGIGNGSVALANVALQGGNVTLSGGTANGGNIALIGSYLAGWADAVNLNALADTPISIQMPTTKYLLTEVWFTQISGTSANAIVSVSTLANGGGTVFANLTPGIPANEATAIYAPMSIPGVGGAANNWRNETTLHVAVTHVEGAAGSANVYLYARPAP